MKIVWPWVTSTKAFFSGASHHNATALKLYVKYLNFKFTILLPETSLQIFVQSTRVGVSWQEPPAYHNWKRLNLKNSSTFEVSGWRWKPLQIQGFSAKKGSVGTRKKKGGNANIFSVFTMMRCYARDRHLCDVWSCTSKIWVKRHIFESGYYEKGMGTHSHTPKTCERRSRPTTSLQIPRGDITTHSWW